MNRCRPAVVAAGIVLCASADALAQRSQRPVMSTTQLADCFEARSLEVEPGVTRPYALFIPKAYDKSKPWPLVMFLHGSGEAGRDGIAQTRVGLGPFLVQYKTKCPFIAVFPQSQGWFRGVEAKAVLAILDAVQRELNVDRDRIYLTGLSMGGFGTWEIAMRRPDLFAAIVPICGGGPPEGAGNLVRTPIWAFHGAQDDRVPVDLSRKLVKRLKELGAAPRYTEFPTVGHFCWDPAYNTKGLFGWMLNQKRGQPPRSIVIDLEPAATPLPTRIWWLRIDAADPAAPAWRVQAELANIREIRIATQGITACSLVDEQTEPGLTDPLTITWNGQTAYSDTWKPEVRLTLPPGAAPTPRPTSGPTSK